MQYNAVQLNTMQHDAAQRNTQHTMQYITIRCDATHSNMILKRAYIHTSMHAYIHTYTYRYIQIHTYNTNTNMHTYLHTYIHTYKYLHTDTYIQIHTHTHTAARVRSRVAQATINESRRLEDACWSSAPRDLLKRVDVLALPYKTKATKNEFRPAERAP